MAFKVNYSKEHELFINWICDLMKMTEHVRPTIMHAVLHSYLEIAVPAHFRILLSVRKTPFPTVDVRNFEIDIYKIQCLR